MGLAVPVIACKYQLFDTNCVYCQRRCSFRFDCIVVDEVGVDQGIVSGDDAAILSSLDSFHT